MKRWILVLFALLGVGMAGAQSFPPELVGNQFYGIAPDLQFFQVEQYNIPFSVPPINEDMYWLTTIFGPEMPPVPLLEVEVECFTGPNGCVFFPPITNQQYVWNPDAQAYVNLIVLPSGDAYIDCYSWKSYSWRHWTGYLDYTGSPPQWWAWNWYFLDETASSFVPYHQQVPLATE